MLFNTQFYIDEVVSFSVCLSVSSYILTLLLQNHLANRPFLGHLSHSGDLSYGLASVVVRRPLASSSQEQLSKSKPNFLCSICRVRRQEILNYMTPIPRGGGGNCRVKSVTWMYFLKIFFSYLGHNSDKLSAY